MQIKTVIFDLDGTLALIDHRREYLKGDKPDWNSFNHWLNVEQDLPNMPIFCLLYDFIRLNYKIIFVTGRSDILRGVTENWLNKYIGSAGMFYLRYNPMNLIMRKDGDNRKDAIIKKEVLDALLVEGHDILFAIDDRKSVVDMWRRNGITCLQVAEGDF